MVACQPQRPSTSSISPVRSAMAVAKMMPCRGSRQHTSAPYLTAAQNKCRRSLTRASKECHRATPCRLNSTKSASFATVHGPPSAPLTTRKTWAPGGAFSPKSLKVSRKLAYPILRFCTESRQREGAVPMGEMESAMAGWISISKHKRLSVE